MSKAFRTFEGWKDSHHYSDNDDSSQTAICRLSQNSKWDKHCHYAGNEQAC